MRLNSILQFRGEVRDLTWEAYQIVGHSSPWTAIAYSKQSVFYYTSWSFNQIAVHGVEWGRGVAQTCAQAKEVAARGAYVLLFFAKSTTWIRRRKN